MKLFRSFLTKLIAIPVGFLLSLFGVILPWRARNKFLNLLGFVIGAMLRSKTVVDFFMNIGFKGSSKKQLMLGKRWRPPK